jgi:uncharacterized protein with ParB-like and HNH nuclease domain
MNEIVYTDNTLITDFEVIETDAQTAAQDTGDTNTPYPYDPMKTDIDIKQEQFSIYDYVQQYKKGRLIIDPDFQRNLVWKPKQKSQFIESIILNFPLPSFYVNQKRDNTLVIIDGLQRTTTLIEFLDDKKGFALTGLEKLEALNGKKFSDFPSAYQARIQSKKLLIYILNPTVPTEVIYDLFDRINTGGTSLNRQEVRNAIFNGKSTQLLKKLSEQAYFKKATNNGVSPTRMKDREVILRYLAFKIFDYEKDYQGNMNGFLENTMRKINLMADDDIHILENDFKRVMEITFDFFEDKNFRMPVYDVKGNKSRGSINIAVFESVAYFFSLQSDSWLAIHKNKIQENFTLLVDSAEYENYQAYRDAVLLSTNSIPRVVTRFKLAQKILGLVNDSPF